MSSTQPILIVGDITLDGVLTLPHFPAEGAEVVVRSSATRLGGSGCNTAVALSLLGKRALLAGHLGMDPFGEMAARELDLPELDINLVERTTEAATGFIVVTVSDEARRTMFSARGCNRLPPDLSRVLPALGNASWLHISGYTFLEDGQWAAMCRLIEHAHEAGIPVSLDPSLEAALRARERVLEAVPRCQVLLVSQPELTALSGAEEVERGVAFLMDRGASLLAVKMGERGSRVFSQEETASVPAFAGGEILDTTGAGDCFNAGFLCGLLSGWSRAQSARLGNALAYLAITEGKGVAGLKGVADLWGMVSSMVEAS